VSSLFAGDGNPQTLSVTVDGGPTGIVFNGGKSFVVRENGVSAPARFLYACEDGRIRGWSPVVPHGWSKVAVVAVDEGAKGAIFRGLALATLADGSQRLYATDFHNGRVFVLDGRWAAARSCRKAVDRQRALGDLVRQRGHGGAEGCPLLRCRPASMARGDRARGARALRVDLARRPLSNDPGRTLGAMEELGLFPLGIVLLPSEHVPLHIFEPRYRELIAECLDEQQEFGVIYADGDGVRDVGTRARVIDVLEEFADGRLNVVVEGGARFRVERLTRGRSFLTAIVAPAPDGYGRTDPDTAARAVGSFRALAAVAGAEPDEVDETASQLSFELAAQVELPSDAKQELLELDEEQHRLEFVIRLLDSVREALLAVRELGEHAKTNGSRRPQPS
jgi:Lon protease-like protein